MFTALSLLVVSRKFWVGTITVLGIVAGVVLSALGKIDKTELIATIAGITTLGMTVIGSIAWEDTAKVTSAANAVSSERMITSLEDMNKALASAPHETEPMSAAEQAAINIEIDEEAAISTKR